MFIPSVPTPSPEVKAILKTWVALQKEKYGENWKEILAKEMAAAVPADFKQFIADRLNVEVPKEKS